MPSLAKGFDEGWNAGPEQGLGRGPQCSGKQFDADYTLLRTGNKSFFGSGTGAVKEPDEAFAHPGRLMASSLATTGPRMARPVDSGSAAGLAVCASPGERCGLWPTRRVPAVGAQMAAHHEDLGRGDRPVVATVDVEGNGRTLRGGSEDRDGGVKRAGAWGLTHRPWTPLHVIGIDEVSRAKGQRYLTLI